ncbi:D-3-phosphoglycerate dehydrogenase [compost metagenome]
MNIVIQKSHAAKDFTSLITVSLRTKKEERAVAGTLLTGYGPRIVQIDKFTVDLTPEGNLILISHNDKPGIIGRVGTLLGNNDVNIATMQVGRQLVGGSAIMVLRVDKQTPKDVLNQLTSMPELNTAKEITLF